jgi:translocation and assembly module TamB
MSKPATTNRLGRLLPRVLSVLLLLAIVVALFPVLIAKTGLRNQCLQLWVPHDGLRLTSGGASIGWFTPPAIYDLQLSDASGQPLFTAKMVKIDRSPLALLGNLRSLGTVSIESPVVYLCVRPDGSNWQDIVQALGKLNDEPIAEQESSFLELPSEIQALVQVANAAVVVQDASTGQTWRIENANAEFSTGQNDLGQVAFTVAGRVVSGEDPGNPTPPVDSAGNVADSCFAIAMGQTPEGVNRLDCRCNHVPMGPLTPWLQKVTDRPQVVGWLTVEGFATWPIERDLPVGHEFKAGIGILPDRFATSGYITIEELDFITGGLAADRLRLSRVDAPWNLSTLGGEVLINELACRSEIGTLTAQGTVAWASLTHQIARDASDLQDFTLQGNLDLARLAQMLPNMLHIRPETTITSGTLNLTIRNQPVEGGAQLSGSLDATQLAATSHGQVLRWEQPIRIDFETMLAGHQFRIDQLECVADFCRITAQGDAQDLRAEAQFDLSRLAQQLGQFIDLDAWQPAGTGTAQLVWQKTVDGQFSADSSFNLDRFALQSGGITVWEEPQLQITTTVQGAFDQTGRLVRLDAGELQLRAVGDALDATLQGAIDFKKETPLWSLAVRARGHVGRWLARAHPVVNTTAWQVEGELDLNTELRLAADQLDVSSCKLIVTDLHGVGAGWKIDEPHVELTGDLRWDGRQRQVVSRELQFVCSTAAVAGRDVQVVFPTEGLPVALGTLAVRADVARLGSLRSIPGQRASWETSGMVEGNLRFEGSQKQVRADLRLQGDNLALAQLQPRGSGYETIWKEPVLTVTGQATYQKQAGLLSLDALQIHSQTLAMTTSGTVARLQTTGDVKLRGTLDYDLARIAALIKPYVGAGVEFQGREQATFEVEGPLRSVNSKPAVPARLASTSVDHWSQGLRANFAAPWQGARVFGLLLGPGVVQGELVGGTIRFAPLDVSVAQGRFSTAPVLRTAPPPGELILPPGKLFTNVNVSPEVSDLMLKYIAPVLADATRSDGLFSMDLSAARVPLADGQQADVAGTLEIHTMDVLPGPSTEQWAGLAQTVENLLKNRNPQALVNRPSRKLLEIRDCAVPFRLIGGRVYHEGLEFHVGDVVVRSQGSVGLDQTLDLTVTIPIPEQWVADLPWLAGLLGQDVTIPVRGTLSRPAVDASAVTMLSTQLLRGIAGGALGEELGGGLNKALQKLLGP